ncbi:MAG: hypothetical protein WCH35_12435 [Comamonadaceae bacterium]
MTPSIELQSDTLRREIAPTLGGASAESLGVQVLQAGESMSAQMSIHVERVL